jgi:sirohydrochlorin cobaltochelatase
MKSKYERAILAVSSGTTNKKAREENITAIIRKFEEEFKDYEIKGAFTSQKIIVRLKDDGLQIDTPKEALQKLKEQGVSEVIIQPLHIIPGGEYRRLMAAAEEYRGSFEKIIVSTPLLFSEMDYEEVAHLISQEFHQLKEYQAVVFMGHGGRGEGNQSYSILQRYIDKLSLNAFIGTISAEPGLQSIIERLKIKNIKEVILTPFMLVAGNHALMDMASEEETSWKSTLEREGFKVSVQLHGLGEKVEYQKLYIKKVRMMIQ